MFYMALGSCTNTLLLVVFYWILWQTNTSIQDMFCYNMTLYNRRHVMRFDFMIYDAICNDMMLHHMIQCNKTQHNMTWYDGKHNGIQDMTDTERKWDKMTYEDLMVQSKMRQAVTQHDTTLYAEVQNYKDRWGKTQLDRKKVDILCKTLCNTGHEVLLGV